ncbi:hypothetical protein LTR95_013478 [Oleoguttula sp. CCFEE 5521]
MAAAKAMSFGSSDLGPTAATFSGRNHYYGIPYKSAFKGGRMNAKTVLHVPGAFPSLTSNPRTGKTTTMRRSRSAYDTPTTEVPPIRGKTPISITQRPWSTPSGFLNLVKSLAGYAVSAITPSHDPSESEHITQHQTTITSVDTPGGKRRAVEKPHEAIRSSSRIPQLSYVATAPANAPAKAPVIANSPSRIPQFGRTAMQPAAKKSEPQKPTSGVAGSTPGEWTRDRDCPLLNSPHPIGSAKFIKDVQAWKKAREIWRNTPRIPTKQETKNRLLDEMNLKLKEKLKEAKKQHRARMALLPREDPLELEQERARHLQREKMFRRGEKLIEILPWDWDVTVDTDTAKLVVTPPPSRPASSDGDTTGTADLRKRHDALRLKSLSVWSKFVRPDELRAPPVLQPTVKQDTQPTQLAADDLKPLAKSTESVTSGHTTSSKQGDSIIDHVSAEALADLRAKLTNNRPNNTINTIGGFVLKRTTYDRILSTADGTDSWLDDEAVNAWFRCIVDEKTKGWTRGANKAAPYATFNTAWYKTVVDRGVQGIKTWGRRQGIDGRKLLDCESLYLPINTGAHWTLLIINGKARTYEYLDSLSGNSDRAFKITKDFLAMHLGSEYKAQEWTASYRSRSRRQANMSDCGVFTCFNGLASTRNVNYNRVYPNKMPQAREKMAIVLENGGFAGL